LILFLGFGFIGAKLEEGGNISMKFKNKKVFFSKWGIFFI